MSNEASMKKQIEKPIHRRDAEARRIRRHLCASTRQIQVKLRDQLFVVPCNTGKPRRCRRLERPPPKYQSQAEMLATIAEMIATKTAGRPPRWRIAGESQKLFPAMLLIHRYEDIAHKDNERDDEMAKIHRTSQTSHDCAFVIRMSRILALGIRILILRPSA